MTEQNQPEQKSTNNALESIQQEISSKLNDQHKKSIPWNNILVTAVLAVLTLVSLAQMMASINIFNKVKKGGIGPVNASTGIPQNNSLESLPDMVGGC